MINAAQVLESLRQAGIEPEVLPGNRLSFPPGVLNDAQRQAIRQYKAELLRILSPVSATIDSRIKALVRYQFIDHGQADALRDLWRQHQDAAETKLFRLEVERLVTPCDLCAHSRKPGTTVHCGSRPDLSPAYGPNHPLRELPTDRGHSCDTFTSR